jgi:hypothetical protein
MMALPARGTDEIEMRRFLQLALDLVDDLVLHLLDRGARPDSLNDHDAEGEIRVFLLAHAHKPSTPAMMISPNRNRAMLGCHGPRG